MRLSGLFGFLLFFLPSFALAQWQEIHCENPESSTRLTIQRDPSGNFRVATEHTQVFLLGLQCQVPLTDEPLFACESRHDGSVTFTSVWLTEYGFPLGEYGNTSFVNRKNLVIALHRSYVAADGTVREAKRKWTFDPSECQWR